MLTPQQNNFLRLLLRSPDCGEGWRTVSATVWPLVQGFELPELLELEPSEEGGGRVRLSDRGAVLVDYL